MFYQFIVRRQTCGRYERRTEESRNGGKVFQMIDKIVDAKSVVVDVDHFLVVDVNSSVDQNFDFFFFRIDEVDAPVALELVQVSSVVIDRGQIHT